MTHSIPSTADVRERLKRMTLAQLGRLADVSGVPYPTIFKIRYGQTANPGIETVRQFFPHIDSAAATPSLSAPAAAAAGTTAQERTA